jgi:hypothetical protein
MENRFLSFKIEKNQFIIICVDEKKKWLQDAA